MKKNILLFLVFLPYFLFSQQWHAYSDSIIVNYKKNNIEKAKHFIELAEEEINKSKLIMDTIYADYLYRKGITNINYGKFNSILLDESLSIWNSSKIKNFNKIMKIHFYLGAGYTSNLDYIKGYENYDKCYQINKINKLPWIWGSNFSLSTYYLSSINYFNFKNFKKAKEFAKEYIENNKELSYNNFDLYFAKAYRNMDDDEGFEKVLLEYVKNYDDIKKNDIKLYFDINSELFAYYYKKNNINEIIHFGEKLIKIFKTGNIHDDLFLEDMYRRLLWAFSVLNDKVNIKKYELLIKE